MNITCKYCASDIKPENINRETLIARCTQCGAVFGVATLLGATPATPTNARAEAPISTTPADYGPAAVATPVAAAAAPARATVAMPKSYTLTEENGDLVLTRMWFDWSVLFMAFMCVFWNGITWTFVASTLVTMRQPTILVFLSFHLLAGLGIAYAVLAKLLNNTVVRVGPGELRVTHGPLPTWGGNKQFATSALHQLYTRERVRRGKHGRRYYSYDVCVLAGPNRKDEVLVAGFPDAQQALFLEQQIEQRLHLQDVAVPGELRR